jgi:hypothetical protein
LFNLLKANSSIFIAQVAYIPKKKKKKKNWKYISLQFLKFHSSLPHFNLWMLEL